MITRRFKQSISRWTRLPATCALCNQYSYDLNNICQPCLNSFTRVENACDHCRLPLSNSICGFCSVESPPFDHLYTNYYFNKPLKHLLHEFKYYNGLFLRGFFVNCLQESLPVNYQSNCLIPIPLHPLKLKERGFNQSLELAKGLAKRLNIPLDYRLCKKIKYTSAQAQLKGLSRYSHVNNTFLIEKACPYKHVTIVDDIVTTGNTVKALADCLKSAGAEQIDIVCIARTHYWGSPLGRA